ncbi:YgaP-like transmembrane domain [Spirosoma spitsbergense]|uniref:YgaP-like transmembrane domain n=1 Tax=Spirosoma spitsbergense TaxID=431554 RepID=UPI0003A49B28
MKKNMGFIDRTIRIVIAIVLVALYATSVISGTWAIVSLVVAGIFVLTSLVVTNIPALLTVWYSHEPYT